MATKLTEPQQKLLSGVQTYFPVEYFTPEEYKAKLSLRAVPTQTLKKLVELGYLEQKDGAYRLIPAGADLSINTYAVEDKKTSADAVAMLFSVRSKIETEYNKILHWMGQKTYATSPESQIGIYRIIDKLNDKIIYIGKTEASFDQRWKQHREELSKGIHHCVGLQEYLNTKLDGDISNLVFEIQEELPADSVLIDNRERYWIDYFGETVMNTARPRLIGNARSLPEITADNKQKTLVGLEKIARLTASAIHDYLYAAVKLSDQNKATLIAGIVIALNYPSFKSTYKMITDENFFVESFDNAIKCSIRNHQGLRTGHDAIYSTFDFIKHNENFKKKLTHSENTYIALQLLTEIIESSICRIAKDYPEYDVMGDFYNEFAKYSGADQQALGIVLTPHHVADFMSDLLEINKNDTILDICCGTGALPIAARRFNTNRIIGVEYQERMMALCLANMIMRGYDSTLYVGDSFGEQLLDTIKEQKPTKMIINPPYAQDGYPEMGFVRRGLDQLVEGGLGVAIVPMSCAIKSDKTLKTLKEEILSKHQLLATFSMPDQLFYPVGVVTIVMLFRAHTPHEDSSFFGYLKDDGFEITRTNGRQDQGKWTEIKDEMLTLYRNYEEKAGISALAEVWEDDEWCCEAYMKTDYSGITPEMFKKEMMNYVLFNLNKGE
jgi:type I restriction-modification system DNA methylase subunit